MNIERVKVRACVGCGVVARVVVRLESDERLCAECVRNAVRVLDTQRAKVEQFMRAEEVA